MGSFVSLLPKYQNPTDIEATAAQSEQARAAAGLTQAQAQGVGLTNQEKTIELQDQKILGEAMRNANGAASIPPDQRLNYVLQTAIKNGLSAKGTTQMMGAITQQNQAVANMQEAQAKADVMRHDAVLGAYDSDIKALPPDQQAAAWPNFVKSQVQSGKLTPQEAAQLPTGYSDTADHMMQAFQLHTAQVKQKLDAAEAQNKATEANAKASDAAAAQQNASTNQTRINAELPGLNATSEMKQRESALQKQAVDAFQQNPQAGASIIDKILPPQLDATANAAYKQAWQSAMQSGGPAAAQKVIEVAATHAASISPQHMQQEVDMATKKEAAAVPYRVAAQVQAERAKADLASGIGRIIDPTQRNEAGRTLDAADKEAIDKISSANSLKNTVQMALGGNKVAPNLETIEELRSIVNRVNGTELKSVGGSGDAYDAVNGFLSKWTAGQPIPENIQKDFLSVADSQIKVAQAKHATAYGTVAQRFKVPDLKAPDIASIYSQSAGGASAPSSTNRPPLSSFEKH